MTKVVIDTDPGTDDAIALIMALNSPALDVQGLTTVGGNATLAHTTRNALRLLEYLGRPDIPVFRGAARPLHGRFHYAYDFHGPGGLTVRLPRPRSEPGPVGAPDYIVSLARSFPGELALIALGPLTNVARAFTREPRLAEWLREIVIMGGAIEVQGNVTPYTPYAEFNVYNDPHAANVVFSSGTPVTLVGLDVCNQVCVTEEDIHWLRGESRGERLAGKVLAGWFASHGGGDRYNLCDPLAMVAAVTADVLTYRRATVTVEVEDDERIGSTAATYDGGHVKVASAVDVPRAKEAIRGLLRG